MERLLMLRKGPEETLRAYSQRYWNYYNEVDEPDKRTATRAFRIGLLIDDEFAKSLYREIPKSLDRLMKMIELECILDEDISR